MDFSNLSVESVFNFFFIAYYVFFFLVMSKYISIVDTCYSS